MSDSVVTTDTDFILKTVKALEGPITELYKKFTDAKDNLSTGTGASDPQKLAEYQAAFSAYNVYRQAVSFYIKGVQELDTTLSRNLA